MLGGSLDRFTKLLARYELFKLVLDLPGDIVEGGVLKGTGLLYWARLLKIYSPLSKRKIVGFDTFEGYPADTATYEHDQATGRAFKEIQVTDAEDVSMRQIMEAAEDLGLAGIVELVKGDATVTIEQYVKDNPGFRVALLDLDFVLYDPTMAALEHLYPLVVPGGVIIFDEYAGRGWGESDAVDQFFRAKGESLQLQTFPWAMSPTAYMIKKGL
jgi:hypothetical protein